jgi:hypothetical protein
MTEQVRLTSLEADIIMSTSPQVSSVPLGRNSINGGYMKTLIAVCFLISILYCNGFSQGYFPLQKGNQWDFGIVNFPPTIGYQYQYSIKVLGDTIMANAKTYAIVSNQNHISYKRQEGSIVYDYDSTGDVIEHNFTWKDGDTTVRNFTDPDSIITIVRVGFGNVFGRNLKSWMFSTQSINNKAYEPSEYTITDSLGYTFFGNQAYNYYCMGIVVDGKTYGTVTQVMTHSNDSPNRFELFQNYPNPFNPSTTFRFYLPFSGNVKLSVYNVLGEQVAIVANDYFTLGEHDVQWNATKLSSGIYFYTIQSGSYLETKKSVLLK